jgi:hypothetical protein
VVALSDLDGNVYLLREGASGMEPERVWRGEAAPTSLYVLDGRVMVADGTALREVGGEVPDE